MILVFGGAYQGKTEYAQGLCGAAKDKADHEAEICDLTNGGEPDFTKEIITRLDAFALRCVQEGVNPADYFRERRDQWEHCVLVATDISQGVVPIDKTLRAAREANGRLLIYLAEEAEQVHRVFCGIGKRIK